MTFPQEFASTARPLETPDHRILMATSAARQSTGATLRLMREDDDERPGATGTIDDRIAWFAGRSDTDNRRPGFAGPFHPRAFDTSRRGKKSERSVYLGASFSGKQVALEKDAYRVPLGRHGVQG